MADIDADLLSSDLSTSSNKLSVWRVDSEEDEINAFIALGSNCNNLGTIWAVKISEDDVQTLSFEDNEGDIPAKNFNKQHRDISRLNYISMGTVIQGITNAIRDGRVVKKGRGEMKKLLSEAYSRNELDKDRMQTALLKAISGK